jgi:hypothetical protein
MKMYAVMGLVREQKVNIGNHKENTVTQEIKLTWVDGMIGVIPVFDNKKDADKYAGEKFEVLEMSIQLKIV